MSTTRPADASVVKACCAAAYEGDWVRLLLGDSFHPGGIGLTLHLGRLLELGPTTSVLDVACGRGTSAIALAREFGCRVTGVDLSEANVEAARGAAREGGVEHLVSFRAGDGEALPIPDASVDAVICECAFCTFPDKGTAAAEFARVLRPGGRLGLTDLTRTGVLPHELESLLGWVACIADARPVDEYVGYLEAAGLSVEFDERHDQALRDLAARVRMRLVAAQVAVRLGRLDFPVEDIAEAKRLAKSAEQAIEDGRLGYALILGGRAGAS